MQELRDYDKEWKTGDRVKAKEMAKAYVAENKSAIEVLINSAVRALREFKLNDPASIPELVELVSLYRQNGGEDDRILLDMYLMAEHEPQKITGTVVFNPASLMEANRNGS